VEVPSGPRPANDNVTPLEIKATGTDPAAPPVPRFVKPGRPSEPRPIEGPRTSEEWKQAGKRVEEGDYRPPERQITAQPKERSLESQRSEEVGLADEAPEIAAVNKGPLGAQAQSRDAAVGNAVHDQLIPWLERLRAGGNFDEAARLEEIARLEEVVPGWPQGVLPNRSQFTMSDGRVGRPDGIQVDGGFVIELKPNTASAWAQRGPYQAQEYADVLNAAKYAGRQDWKPLTLTYDVEAAEKYLVGRGYLAPKPQRPSSETPE
jgi:hypothetical protein